MGPTQITVKSERQKSKFNGKPDYFTLAINGEDFYYSVDSEACAKTLAGRVGQTFTVQAQGGKGAEELVYVGQPGTQVQQPPPHQEAPAASYGGLPAPAAQPQQPPPATNAPDPVRAATNFIGRNRAFNSIALRATFSLVDEVEAARREQLKDANWQMHPTLVTAIFTAHLYGAERQGIPGQHMPMDITFTKDSKKGGAK